MSYIGNTPLTAAFLTDTFSGDSSTVAFTMTVAPATTSSILVSVSGVVQDPSTYSVAGTVLTFSAAPATGTGNISVRFLGIPASGVATTSYRTVTEFTATSGQTTFTPPSYTVGYINVYLEGALLGSSEYTATNGTTVALATGATAGDLVTIESFYVSSVLNAIPAAPGAVGSAYIAAGAVETAQIAAGAVGNTQMASGAARANWGAGGVLQVVSTTITAVSSTSSTTWANISGFAATITPTSTSSKIFIELSLFGSSGDGGGFIKVQRNGTDVMVGSGATSNRINATMGPFYYYADSNVGFMGSQNYLDEPASTSALTYQVLFRQGVANSAFYVNRNASNVDQGYTAYQPGTITLFEIAG